MLLLTYITIQPSFLRMFLTSHIVITPPSSVITNQDGSSAFKRHNSDNTSARQSSKEECKPNNDLKEEIERKRLAAIKRRNEKSQLKEEIERKRQAAIKRRNEKSQQ